jgi:hypothetical protein
MTVTQRKPQHLPDEIQSWLHLSTAIYIFFSPFIFHNFSALNEPGVQYQCDSCACDLTHTIRIKCANAICMQDEGIDLCPACFCAGKEFGKHKRGHAYRVIVRGHLSNASILTDLNIPGNELLSHLHWRLGSRWVRPFWHPYLYATCLIAVQGTTTANGNIQPRHR